MFILLLSYSSCWTCCLIFYRLYSCISQSSRKPGKLTYLELYQDGSVIGDIMSLTKWRKSWNKQEINDICLTFIIHIYLIWAFVKNCSYDYMLILNLHDFIFCFCNKSNWYMRNNSNEDVIANKLHAFALEDPELTS